MIPFFAVPPHAILFFTFFASSFWLLNVSILAIVFLIARTLPGFFGTVPVAICARACISSWRNSESFFSLSCLLSAFSSLFCFMWFYFRFYFFFFDFFF